MRRWLTQRATGQQKLIAKGLLAINQHHIMPSSAQVPVLKTVVQQQGVAAKFFNRITPALHPVLVHQHHDVLEVRGEHVGLVARHVGIQQQGFAIGHHPWRRLVLAEQQFVQQHLVHGPWPGPVTARQNCHVSAGIAQFARKFLHHRGLSGAPHGQVANGNHLHAQGFVPEDAKIVQPAPDFDRHFEHFGAAEERGPRQPGFKVMPIPENDFEEEGFKTFGPDPEFFTHQSLIVSKPRPRGKPSAWPFQRSATYSLSTPPVVVRLTLASPLPFIAARMVAGGTHSSIVVQ